MSKKNTLNEVRRFMKLANLDAGLSSNFVTKLEEMDHAYVRDDEDEMEEGMHDDEEEAEEAEDELEIDADELDADADLDAEEDMEMDMDMELDAEEEADEAVLTDDEADAIIALADKLRAARDEDEDAEEAGELEADMELDAGDDVMEEDTLEEETLEEEEETLEEILQDVLGEGEHEDDVADTEDEKKFFDGEKAEDIALANLQKKAAGEKPHDRTPSAGAKAKKRMASRKRETPKLNEEDLVQEVLRRVKVRLSEMSKSKE